MKYKLIYFLKMNDSNFKKVNDQYLFDKQQRLIDFSESDLALSPDQERKTYYQHSMIRKSNHPGQLKLLLSEMMFILYFWDSKKYPNPIFLYAGAMEGNHIKFLSEMFPSIQFVLYDKPTKTRTFKVEEVEDRIEIRKKWFDDEDIEEFSSEEYRERGVYLISDIRSISYAGEYERLKDMTNDSERSKLALKLSEEGIVKDMKLQQEWVKKLNPVESLLKLRFTFPGSIKEDIPENNQYPYLAGHVFFQPFVGSSSSELKLVPVRNKNGEFEEKIWNIKEIEEWVFYHNSITRVSKFYLNVFDGTSSLNFNYFKFNDYDNTNMAFILKKYFENTNQKENHKLLAEKWLNWIRNNLYGERSSSQFDYKINKIQFKPKNYEQYLEEE